MITLRAHRMPWIAIFAVVKPIFKIYIYTFARNAIPATPARFMHRFSCRCMMQAGPRPVWAERVKAVHVFSCKSMRAMHASLFTKRLARQRASERQRTGTKKPLVGQRLCGVNEPGGMQNRNGPASGVPLPAPAVLPVLFPAVAVR